MDARSIDRLRQAIGTNRPFQPDTDANDDYAVLEWMRAQDDETQRRFHQRLARACRNRGEYDALYAYRIGNYARAALEVLGND